MNAFVCFFEADEVVMKVGNGRGVQKFLRLGYKKILGYMVAFYFGAGFLFVCVYVFRFLGFVLFWFF